MLLITCSLSSAGVAGISPFKKDINLEFGAEIPWEINSTSLVKSGVAEQRNIPRYYHLNINEQQLLLRLTTSKTNIEVQNAMLAKRFELLDIFTHNQRLPVFQWCMNNRISPHASYKALNKYTLVKDNICSINIDKGKITIKLDNESRDLLTQARTLSVDIRLGKYISHLTYDMQGFSQKLDSLNSNKIRFATKPCYISPPDQFSKKIKSINYPCNNKRLKQQAKKTVSHQISQHRHALQIEQRRLKDKEELSIAKIEKQRLQKISRDIELETTQRELKWKKMKTRLWVGRCMKHWNKGTSPCYCQPYLERAPTNTKDTCNKQNDNRLTQE